MVPARILLVDDDPLFIRRAQAMANTDIELQVARNRSDALLWTARWNPDVVVVDALLADAFGLLDDIRADTGLGVIFLSEGPGALTRFQSGTVGFFGVIQREAGLEALLDGINRALRHAANAIAPLCPCATR